MIVLRWVERLVFKVCGWKVLECISKCLGFSLDDCCRKVENGMKVVGVIQSLLDGKSLSLECVNMRACLCLFSHSR